MGGEDLVSGSKMSNSGSGKPVRLEDGVDPVMSKLLKDFTSAELLHSKDQDHSVTHETKSDSTWNEVILAVKHLHVRRPDFKKNHKAKKHSHIHKGSSNLLNLAIAAGNLQRPIVWPARLNCDCKKSSTSMLIPSKLKINGSACCSTDRSLLQTDNTKIGEKCFSCNGKSNKKYLSSRQQEPKDLFGHSSNVSSLSFNRLCLEQNSANTLNIGGNLCKSRKAGNKMKGASATQNTTNNRQQHLFSGKQLFTNTPLEPLQSSDTLCSSGSPIDNIPSEGVHATYAKSSTYTCLATAVPEDSYPTASHRPYHHSSASPAQHPSYTSGPGRSCSQEMRDMEDTNVNELASYLEDLLHIPRKMSTMAEMMYA